MGRDRCVGVSENSQGTCKRVAETRASIWISLKWINSESAEKSEKVKKAICKVQGLSYIMKECLWCERVVNTDKQIMLREW